jgi:prepilin-type N-terminal cleavage/methylation domain-containing protein
MSRSPHRTHRGFSLIELMVALALGLLITGAAVKLYTTGVDATWVIQQRAELQQDLRAAEDMILKDISLAGAGLTTLPGESVPLPNGAAGSPVYGCSAGPVCPPNGAVNYPNIGGGGPTLFPIMPGFQLGIKPPGSTTKSDLITVVYSDNILALNCYSGSSGGAAGASAANNAITFNGTGNTLTFTAPVNVPSVPSNCVLPPNLAYPQALNNTVNGLQPGDLILFGPLGVQSAVGEVTTVNPPNPGNAPAAPGSQYTVAFANADTLNINQSGVANDLTQFPFPAGGGQLANLVANRIFVITYYLGNWTDAAGNVTTILYRQVNGHQAVPLVDNVANMQFTYDSYDNLGNLLVQVGDAGESLGDSPNLIRKVNIIHLTVHSQLYGSKSSLMATQGFQSFDIQTSISARNASFTNRY